MCIVWTALFSSLLALTVVSLVWLANRPGSGPSTVPGPTTAPAPAGPAVRIGLIPERDVFPLRKRYRALADYIAVKLGRPVELLTSNTYEGMLLDFKDNQIELAFAGSLVAAMAMDRYGAKVLVKPELPGGISTYSGVIFVRADSPVTKVDQLKGKTVAMLRTTTAGNLFPSCQMARMGVLGKPDSLKPLWVGTHDDVANEVLAGRVDAGAIKNRLAESKEVPNNALLVRADLAESLGPRIREILLAMDGEAEGQKALQGFGAVKFIPCLQEQYRLIYCMAEHIGDAWSFVGIAGPPPRTPAGMTIPKDEKCCDANS
jgi:phosphonate transport system substrate-binding protein